MSAPTHPELAASRRSDAAELLGAWVSKANCDIDPTGMRTCETK
jgi:hypothetical protein